MKKFLVIICLIIFLPLTAMGEPTAAEKDATLKELLSDLQALVDSIKDATYANTALQEGTMLNDEYKKIIDKDYDMLLDTVVSALTEGYNDGWIILNSAGYEALYTFLTDGYIPANAKQSEAKRQEIVRAALVKMLNMDANESAKQEDDVWSYISGLLAGSLPSSDEMNSSAAEIPGMASDALWALLGELAWHGSSDIIAYDNNMATLNKLEKGTGYALEALSWILKYGAIRADTEAEKAALATFATHYGKQIYLLDTIESNAKSETVKSACRQLRREIQDAAEKNFESTEAKGSKAIWKLMNEIQLSVALAGGEAAVGGLVALGESAGVTTGMTAATLAKSSFGVAGGISIGCIVGDLATYYTGETVEGRHETLQRAIVASELRTSMVDMLFATEQDSEALYQLSRLYLYSLYDAYDAMAKMFHGTQASLLIAVFDNKQAQNAKTLEAYCKDRQDDIAYALTVMQSDYEYYKLLLECTPEPTPKVITVGYDFTHGSCEQDANTQNRKEPIPEKCSSLESLVAEPWDKPVTTIWSKGNTNHLNGAQVPSDLLGQVIQIKENVGGWLYFVAPEDGDYAFSVNTSSLKASFFEMRFFTAGKGKDKTTLVWLRFDRSSTIQTKVLENIKAGTILYWWDSDDTGRAYTQLEPYELKITLLTD